MEENKVCKFDPEVGMVLEDKRRRRVTVEIIEEDGSYTTQVQYECNGCAIFAFDQLEEKAGMHKETTNILIRCSTLDIANALKADDSLEPVREILVLKEHASMLMRMMGGKEE